MKFNELEKLVEQVMLDEACPPAPGVSGQDSERNLVDAVNHYVTVNGGPFTIKAGEFGTVKVSGADQLGGGRPEPKADVEIKTNKGPLFISMKKANFAMIQSWAPGKTILKYLVDAGLSAEHALQVIDDKLIPKVKAISKEERATIVAEKLRWIKFAQAVDPNYTYAEDYFYQDNPVLRQAMMDTPGWHTKRGPTSPESIPNHYIPLMDVVGEKAWRNMVRIAVAGDSENPQQANSVLICGVPNALSVAANWDAPKKAASIKTLEDIFAEIITIEKAIDDYADPSYDKGIMFRLRPITKVKSLFNSDSSSRYRMACKGGGKKKGEMDQGTGHKLADDEDGVGFWCNDEIGWLIFVTSQKQGAKEKAKSVAMAQANKKFFEEPDEGWEAYYNEIVSFEDMPPEEKERAMRGGEDAPSYSQFEEQKTKHLTKTPGSYTMLSEMIKNLMGE